MLMSFKVRNKDQIKNVGEFAMVNLTLKAIKEVEKKRIWSSIKVFFYVRGYKEA